DEPVDLVDDHPAAFLAGTRYHDGHTAFALRPGTGACAVEIAFRSPLRGAKVDVSAWGEAGTMTLMHEERVGGSVLQLHWGEAGVRELNVTVHDHLREDPVIERWKSSCRMPAEKLAVSDAYRLGHSLYYLQPPGPAVVLCNKP